MVGKRVRKAPAHFKYFAVGGTYPSTSDTGDDAPSRSVRGDIDTDIMDLAKSMADFKKNTAAQKSDAGDHRTPNIVIKEDVIISPAGGSGCVFENESKSGQTTPKRKFSECEDDDDDDCNDMGVGMDKEVKNGKGNKEENGNGERNGKLEEGRNDNGDGKEKEVGGKKEQEEEDDDEEAEEENNELELIRALKLLSAIWTTLRNFRVLFNTKITNLSTEINVRFDGLDRRISVLEREIRTSQSSSFPDKPDCLPLRTLADLQAFETIPNETFHNVVNFLGKLSNGNIEERANIILKIAMQDSLSKHVTMQGGHHSPKIEGTRFSDALYAAVATNLSPTNRPSRREFITAMTASLKAAKQRLKRSDGKA